MIDDQEADDIMSLIPSPLPGSKLRQEQFGGMLASGNLPILNLNSDAIFIWKLMDNKRTISEIENIILENYDQNNVHEFLIDFMRFCSHIGCITLRKPSQSN